MNDRSDVQTRRFALIGMIGGFICSIADYLPEYTGALSNQTVGAYGVIETAWADMGAWRFPASIWIAAFHGFFSVLVGCCVAALVYKILKHHASLFFFTPMFSVEPLKGLQQNKRCSPLVMPSYYD